MLRACACPTTRPFFDEASQQCGDHPSCAGGQLWDGSGCVCPASRPNFNTATSTCVDPCWAGSNWNRGSNRCECDPETPVFDQARRRCVPRPGAPVLAQLSPQAQQQVFRGGSGTCPEGMVFIPGGTYWMGAGADEGATYERPQHAVTLSPFCMDRYEVRVADYRNCVNANACTLPYTFRDEQSFNAFCNWGRAGFDDHPINCVDWDQSTRYCGYRGGRLPTEAEWEWAAGGGSRLYPWGDAPPSPQLTNLCGEECIAALNARGVGQNRQWLVGEQDPWPSTAPVGSFPAGVTPQGLHDMAGNVFEWTADWYSGYSAVAQANPSGPTSGTNRVNRGAGWGSGVAGAFRSRARTTDVPSHRGVFLGIRCVARAL